MSNQHPVHPMAHLLLRSGLAMDLSQIDVLMQARRRAELGVVAPPPALLAHQVFPGQFLSSHLPAPPQPRMIVPEPSKKTEIDEESSSFDEDEDEVGSGNKARLPAKRNPNDLNTAAPVTCMEDFVKMPITTKLNNLKLPAKAKGPKASAAMSANDMTPKQFSSEYLPRDQDVVVDMAHHPNREFKNLIRQSLPNYLTASQPKRKSLIAAILSTVSQNGGHFIRFWSAQQSWVEVQKLHAERFTAQALQDAASQRGSFAVSQSPQDTSSVISSGSDNYNATQSPANGIHPNMAVARRRISYGRRNSFSAGTYKRSQPEHRSSFSCSRTNPMKEIPIKFRKRPSQSFPSTSLPCTSNLMANDPSADRSALLLKFKRPKTSSSEQEIPRKVSLETHKQNPFEFLSQITALGEDGDSSDSGEY